MPDWASVRRFEELGPGYLGSRGWFERDFGKVKEKPKEKVKEQVKKKVKGKIKKKVKEKLA